MPLPGLAMANPPGTNGRFLGPITVGTALYDQYGNAIPSQIDTGSYYFEDDYCGGVGYVETNANTNSNQSFTVGALSANNPGIGWVETASATSGGILLTNGQFALTKNAQVTWQWRQLFYTPASASTPTNRYTIYIGGIWPGGTANASWLPIAGPYISYTDNVNGGNWVIGSSYGTSILTTTNTNVAPTFGAWHALTITLFNGVYTFVLDGVTLGTVTDAHFSGTPNTSMLTGIAGIAIIPATFTAPQALVIDRADFLVTGLTR